MCWPHLAYDMGTLGSMGPSAPSGPQLGDLPTAHLAEFRQQCDEREREDRTDARHGSQEPIALSQGDIGGGDHRGEPLVDQCDIQRKAHETAAIQTPQDRVLEQSGCILGRDFLVAELPSRGSRSRPSARRPRYAEPGGLHGGDEQRNHSGNELAKLKWVHLSDGYARREQGTEDAALVATTRLNANGRAPSARICSLGGQTHRLAWLPLRPGRPGWPGAPPAGGRAVGHRPPTSMISRKAYIAGTPLAAASGGRKESGKKA